MRVRAKREMSYMSRMLKAGDEFDATPVDAKYYLDDASVESLEVEPAAAPRRGRPPRRAEPSEASEPEPQPAEPADEFEGKTVTELREMAEARGLELDPGYMRRDELVALLRGQPT